MNVTSITFLLFTTVTRNFDKTLRYKLDSFMHETFQGLLEKNIGEHMSLYALCLLWSNNNQTQDGNRTYVPYAPV